MVKWLPHTSSWPREEFINGSAAFSPCLAFTVETPQFTSQVCWYNRPTPGTVLQHTVIVRRIPGPVRQVDGKVYHHQPHVLCEVLGRNGSTSTVRFQVCSQSNLSCSILIHCWWIHKLKEKTKKIIQESWLGQHHGGNPPSWRNDHPHFIFLISPVSYSALSKCLFCSDS